ncbi:MAG: quinone-dependent dihydroorotate dehydrogenase [Bifidobacteriaceae bacterium]|nr:quinone-dependent dihydroorotate dehydrogenase [Bifidobacteriaceae bacterium]
MYRVLFERVFVRLDPELAHRVSFALIRLAGAVPPLRALIHRMFVPRRIPPVSMFGRTAPGRLGLAAGFAKNGEGIAGLAMLGFAHIEIGTVTALAQPGNPQPRLWRVLDQRGLRNRMGFNNQGAARVARRLASVRRTKAGRAATVGVNIGKSKVTPLERAPYDYATSARLLAPYADYLVVNVSSPNTPGLRDLQATDHLREILLAVRHAADAVTPHRPAEVPPGVLPGQQRVPLLVKIAPDLTDEEIDAIADLAVELQLDGVVAVNTTVAHPLGEGGLSGPALRGRGVEVVGRLRQRMGDGPVIIGVGGISDVDAARAYLSAGATVIQAYTGFIYEGPAWPGRINAAI